MRKLVSGVVPVVVVACLLSVVGVSPAVAQGPEKKGRGVLEVVCVDRDDQSLRVPSGACARDEDRVRVSVAEQLRVRRGLVVPNNEGAWFCAAPGRGTLRVIDRPAQCKKGTAFESRNHRPGPPELSDAKVPEEVPIGTAVGALTAVDKDAADRMTYRLVGGDTDDFAIVDGALVTSARLDFETRADYRVRVQVTDLLGLARTATYDVAVTDAQENRPPTDVSLGGSAIDENQPAGALVGTLSTTDPDTADEHTYTLVTAAGVANDNPLFSIAGGELRTVAPFDFEKQGQLSIRVRTDDGAGGSFEKDLTVAVADAPDAPTAIDLSPGTIAENQAGEVGALTATDQDKGEQHTFSLVAGEGDRDNGRFAVSGNRLSLVSPADFESRSALTARVRVTDKDGRTYDQAVSVSVTNAAEAPTGLSLSPASVRENEPVGTRVGTLSATDPDGGGATFTLVSGTGFRIQGAELLTTESFDYEADASHSIRVRATDASGLTTEAALTVTVLNRNEPATRLDLSSSTVDEDAEVGTVVGTLSTDDPDLDDPITYSLLDDAGGAFAVDGDELVTAAELDRTVATSHTVEVRAEDAGGASIDASFVISVENVNDAPSAPSINDDTVDENLAPGAVVGQLTATDPDAGDTLTYELVNGQGDDDNMDFEVSGTTLMTTTPFNHETRATYSIRVRVTDSGTPRRSTDAVLTIHIGDVNEAPSQPSLSPSSIAENKVPGTLVGALSATDPDVGDTLTYTLVDGSDSAHFSVVAGGVYALGSFDFEDTDSYTIEVEVTDGDETASATLTVTVTDANDAPSSVSLSHASIAENAAARAIGTLSTSDPDAGDSHTYSLPDGEADNDEFVVVGDDLRSAGPFDHETQPSREVLVRSTDAAGAHVEETFTIAVTDVNEAPTSVALAPVTYFRENLPTQVAGSLSATDPDGDSTTYSLVSGVGDDDNGSFEIDGTTLRATAAFDFETQPTVSVRVRATDPGGLSREQVLTFNVVDDDDKPTGVVFKSGGSVAENRPTNTFVGQLDIVDIDGQYTTAFSQLSETARIRVQRDGRVYTQVPLNHETTPEITVRVRVEDESRVTYTGDVTVTVTDVNEAPTRVDLSPAAVDENEPAGTVVGTLTAVDSDAEVDDPTFELVSGASEFEIDGDQLVTKDSFDHETTASYSINVRATDAGGLGVTTPITVTVNQVNEKPSIIGAATLPVSENEPTGTTVASLAATDPESDALAWSLVNGDGSADNAKFTITSAGELQTAASFDYESLDTLHVRVRVTDGSLTDERELTVLVQDVNDAPVAVDDSFTGAIGNTAARAGSATVPATAAYTTLSGTLPLANDTDQDGDTITIVPRADAATDLGGTVDLGADGSFRYYPPQGVKNQDDRFTYQVQDAEGATGTGHVTISIANRRVWYVGSIGSAVTPNGTSRAPYADFGSLNGVNDADETGDEIFLYSNVTGALALEQDQQLLGSAAGLPGVTLSSGVRPRLTASGGYAVSLANGSTVDGVELYGDGANDVVRASSLTTASIASGAAIRQAGSGTAVQISGAAGGDILIGSAVAVTGTGRAVSVSGRTGGTVAFSRTVSAANATLGAVALSGNTGATISFAAVQVIGAGPAFSATGGGTVTVSGVNSTLQSTAGTALTVQNTTIGAGGLTFQRIDSAGGTNGIRLENTGTSGSLTVTGSSFGSCGGTLTAAGAPNLNPVPGDCTGGTIASSSGVGVLLSNTQAPSFTRIRVMGSGDDGVRATSVNGLSISNSSIESSGNAIGENGVDIGGSESAPYAGATGLVTITDTAIGGSADTNLFSGTSSGTTSLSLLRNRIYGSATLGAKDGIRVHATSGGTVSLTVSGSFLTGNTGDQVQVVSSGTGRVTAASISRNTTWAGGRGIQVAAGGSPFMGTLSFDIDNNEVRGITGPAVMVVGDNVNGTGYAGYVRGNKIGQAGVTGSCASNGDGIVVDTEDGAGSLRIGLTSNVVNRCAGRGIAISATGGAAAVIATLQANIVNLGDAGATEGLRVEVGLDVADTGRSCLAASGNVFAGGPAKAADLLVVHKYGVLDIAGMSGTPLRSDVEVALAGANASTAVVTVANPVGGTFAGVSTCPTAPN